VSDLGATLQELLVPKGWSYSVEQGARDGWWVRIIMPGQDATSPICRVSFRSEGDPEDAVRRAIAYMEGLNGDDDKG